MPPEEMEEFLFHLPPSDLRRAARTFRQLRHPIWTENKAKLIERYLYYFVLITKHGTYIDGFAGPQQPDKLEMWAAKLVMESKPRWLRHFHLFEIDGPKVEMLRELRDRQPPQAGSEPRRTVQIYDGDFNARISEMLAQHPIGDTEATFCLLDQHTFECDWASISALATHKRSGNKIELFYFIPQGWLDRAISGLKEKDRTLTKWWGDSTWPEFLARRGLERAKYACERFRSELGYQHVYPFPIFELGEGGRAMYYMIHASDHKAATTLMCRAYEKALGVREPQEQLVFPKEWEECS